MAVDHLLTTLPHLPEEYHLSFDFLIASDPSEWRNILHLTIDGNSGKFGARTPAAFVKKDDLHICSAVKDESNYCKNFKIEKNKWILLEVEQNMIEKKVERD